MRREGLWPIGKDGGDKRLNMHGGGKTLRPVSSRREYNALSSGSSAVKLPKLRQKKDGEDSDKTSRGAGSQTELNKKKKKRISFKLGDESQPGSSGPSGVSLDGDDPLGGKGRRSKDKSGSGSGLGDGLGSNTGKGGGSYKENGAGDGMGAGDGADGLSGSRGGFGEDGGERWRNKQGLTTGGGGLAGSNRSGQLDGQDSDDALRRKGLKGHQSSKDDGKGKGGQNDGNNGQSGTQNFKLKAGLGDLGTGAGNTSRSGLGQSATLSSDGDTSGLKSGRGIQGGTGYGTGMGHGKSTEGGKNRNTDSDLTSSSQVSRAGSSKGSGSRRGSLAMSDHGKNVRKGVGYMRAVSPTSSEWGDPHHGRSFISSIATSRTGSTSNLLRDLEREKDEEPTSKSLPAIVPQIKKKQPLMDFSDLMGGFQLTRAWTFSYHNKM